jgi:regulatory GntR family protein
MRLPSTRLFASELGISRTTVVLAYEHLVLEGYLQSWVGRGTIVVLGLPVPLSLDQPERPADAPQSYRACVIERRGSAARARSGAVIVYDGESMWPAGLTVIGLYGILVASFRWGQGTAIGPRHRASSAEMSAGAGRAQPARWHPLKAFQAT